MAITRDVNFGSGFLALRPSLRIHILPCITSLLLLSACSGAASPDTTEQDIVGGRSENGHVSAGYLIAARTGAPNCSAVMIDPHTVLTAAHCLQPAWAGLDRLPVEGSEPFSSELAAALRLQHGGYDAAELLGAGFGQGFPSDAEGDARYTSELVVVHPQHLPRPAPGAEESNANDIAVVITREALPGPFAAIRHANFGAQVTAVGYGCTAAITRDFDRDCANERKSADMVAHGLMNGMLRLAPESPDRGNICHGDSGGPVYLRDTGQLVGIISGSVPDALGKVPPCDRGFRDATPVESAWSFIVDAQLCAADEYCRTELRDHYSRLPLRGHSQGIDP